MNFISISLLEATLLAFRLSSECPAAQSSRRCHSGRSWSAPSYCIRIRPVFERCWYPQSFWSFCFVFTCSTCTASSYHTFHSWLRNSSFTVSVSHRWSSTGTSPCWNRLSLIIVCWPSILTSSLYSLDWCAGFVRHKYLMNCFDNFDWCVDVGLSLCFCLLSLCCPWMMFHGGHFGFGRDLFFEILSSWLSCLSFLHQIWYCLVLFRKSNPWTFLVDRQWLGCARWASDLISSFSFGYL